MKKKYIYPPIQNMSVLYLRYIDDVFMICRGYDDDLTKFLQNINKQYPAIKFDFVISKETVSFLNTKVYIEISKYSSHCLPQGD